MKLELPDGTYIDKKIMQHLKGFRAINVIISIDELSEAISTYSQTNVIQYLNRCVFTALLIGREKKITLIP